VIVFVGLEEERSIQRKGGYTRWIARSHFGYYCGHKETWWSTQNNTRSSHTNCKCIEVQGGIFEHLF